MKKPSYVSRDCRVIVSASSISKVLGTMSLVDFQEVMSSDSFETLRVFADILSRNTVRPKWYQELIECDYNVNEDFEFDWDIRKCTVDEVVTQFEFSDVVRELKNMNISITCPKIEK